MVKVLSAAVLIGDTKLSKLYYKMETLKNLGELVFLYF